MNNISNNLFKGGDRMKVMTIKKATLSKAKEIYELFLCSDKTDFLTCSVNERIQSRFTINKFRKFFNSISISNSDFFIHICEGCLIGMLNLHDESHQRFSHRMSLGMNVFKEALGDRSRQSPYYI